MITKLSKIEDFNTLIKQEGLVLVDFFATWCGPCRSLAPEIEELVEDHPELTVVEVDIDQFQQLAADYNVRSIPSLFLFNNGTVQKTSLGFLSKKALENLIYSK